MIELHNRPEHLMAFAADVPAPAVRDLHDQPTHVQALQHPTHCVALALAFTGILGQPVELLPDLGIAESTY